MQRAPLHLGLSAAGVGYNPLYGGSCGVRREPAGAMSSDSSVEWGIDGVRFGRRHFIHGIVHLEDLMVLIDCMTCWLLGRYRGVVEIMLVSSNGGHRARWVGG